MTTEPASLPFDAAREVSVEDEGHRDLMARIRSGDIGAFERLYTVFYPRLSRFCYRMTQQLDLIEDIINETMLVVWEKPEHFDYSSKVSTWIFGIAYRKALKALAKPGRNFGHVSIDDLEEVLVDAKASPAREAETENFLAAALGSLSPEQRAVVELTFCEGLHYQEIAAILGCPENTVKTRMFHARRKLKTLFGGVGSETTEP